MSEEVEPRFPRETRDVTAWLVVVIIGFGIFLAGLVCLVRPVQKAQIAVIEREDAARPTLYAPPPPKPELQSDPRATLRELRASEDEELHGWSWKDRKAGLARVPIERAMDELAREGLPHR